jgi:hypothetical protein
MSIEINKVIKEVENNLIEANAKYDNNIVSAVNNLDTLEITLNNKEDEIVVINNTLTPINSTNTSQQGTISQDLKDVNQTLSGISSQLYIPGEIEDIEYNISLNQENFDDANGVYTTLFNNHTANINSLNGIASQVINKQELITSSTDLTASQFLFTAGGITDPFTSEISNVVDRNTDTIFYSSDGNKIYKTDTTTFLNACEIVNTTGTNVVSGSTFDISIINTSATPNNITIDGRAYLAEFMDETVNTAVSTAGGRIWIRGAGQTRKFQTFRSQANDAIIGTIETVSNSLRYTGLSDYRAKENVVKLTDATERLKKLNPCRFNFIGYDETVDGFIAHEVQEIVPEAINGIKDAVDESGNPDYQGIDQSKLIPLLIASLQESLIKLEILENSK